MTSNEELTAKRSYTPSGGGARVRSFSITLLRDPNPRVLAWAGVLNVAAAATALALYRSGYELHSVWAVLALAFVAAIAERQSVRLIGPGIIEMSVSFLPFVFTAVALGPLAAFAVGALANLGDLRPPYLRWVVYTPARALTGAVAGLAAGAFGSSHDSLFLPILGATVAAAVANVTIDAFFNIGTLIARGSASPRTYLRAMSPFVLVALPLYVPVIAILIYGYREYSIWTVVAFLAPALALQRVIHLYQEQRDAVQSLGEANEQLERANLSFAAALVTTLDARDRYTAGHSAAVAIYSRDIAKRMELPEASQQLAHLCGLVHDIGKIGLSVGLLEKTGPLTLEERRQMQEHSAIGERILSKVESYSEIARIVRHHHERVDGNGYPDGLASDDIPLLSRIIAAADAYNAMTSDRPYRGAMPSRVARMRLAQAVESQFDTAVVAAFEAILAGSDDAYRIGTRADFDLELQDAASSASARLAGAA